MTVRLRGHHLLCLLTFVGKGYTPAFTANYRRIVARLNEGAAVELVDGPDDICAPMLAEAEHHASTPASRSATRRRWPMSPRCSTDRSSRADGSSSMPGCSPRCAKPSPPAPRAWPA
jgi:hypothetical protein